MRHIATAVVGMGLLAGAAQAASTDAQVWQGTAFVTTVTSACTTANVASVGDDYIVTYRPIIAGSAANTGDEGLTFQSPRSLLHYFTPSASGQSFRTKGTANISGIGSHATSFTGTGAYALKFTPATILLASPQVYITGTLKNFWATTGCTVTLTASLDRRV